MKKTAYIDETKMLIGLFYETYNSIGYGFKSEVYKRGYNLSLRQKEIKIEVDKKLQIKPSIEVLGDYEVDFVINESIIIQITNTDKILDKEILRLFNYVRHSPYKVGLLLNFGLKPEHRRRDN